MADNDITPEFQELVGFLQQSRGFDFGAYKPSSLQRRISKRMAGVGIKEYPEYRNYLEQHPEEFATLFDTILINVTSFFRDKEAWDYVAQQVISTILLNRPSPEPIRIWCAGVASGQEAYTVAMLFSEAMGQSNMRDRVKIYATDADEQALNQARQAAYDQESVMDVPEPLRTKYFDQVGNTFVFLPELRRAVIFGRHDLMQDAPISHLDLIVCRNTLMYFTSEAQEKILTRFHFALNQDGFLFLGKAEMLLTHTSLFVPVDLRHRVFGKQPRTAASEHAIALVEPALKEPVQQLTGISRARVAAFEHAPVAMIYIDNAGMLALANSMARSMFQLTPNDVPRAFNELELSYRPLELRSKIDQARAERHPIVVQQVRRMLGSDKPTQYLDVQLIPLESSDGHPLGILISFSDSTSVHDLHDEVSRAKQDVETAYEELQSSNEELQTTNEELQSSNEELQTTNEELHSTNEELETMNEELQSTNEELEAINSELLVRTTELDDMSGFLHAALDNLKLGVIVVDDDSRVLLWNHQAFELWGLRQEETRGQSLFHLDFGLPVSSLATPIQDCLRGDCPKVIEMDATTRRGEKIHCMITLARLNTVPERKHRVMMLMDAKPR